MLFVSQIVLISLNQAPADTGLTSLLLLQSHLDMTPATEDILNEFATEARRL